MKITEQVHAIKIPFQVPVRPDLKLDRFVYVYLLVGDKLALVDTGVAGSKELIFDAIRRLGRAPEEIAHILLTHTHPDHIGAAHSIKQETGAKIWVHGAEKAWIEDIECQFKERPIPGFHQLIEGSVTVDHSISDQERIDLGKGMIIRVVHTPGHSAGSVSYLLEEDKVLMTGDAVLLAGQMPVLDDWQACVDSLQKLKTLVQAKILLSSWDDPRPREPVTDMLNAGLACLHDIQQAVKKIADGYPDVDAMEMCRRVMDELGLPAQLVNPLTARSIQAVRQQV